jgi:hypothetical protein
MDLPQPNTHPQDEDHCYARTQSLRGDFLRFLQLSIARCESVSLWREMDILGTTHVVYSNFSKRADGSWAPVSDDPKLSFIMEVALSAAFKTGCLWLDLLFKWL